MNSRKAIAGRLVFAGVVVMAGLIAACAPTGGNLRSVTEPTATTSAAAPAPIAPVPPVAPPAPARSAGNVGAPAGGAAVIAPSAPSFAAPSAAIVAQAAPSIAPAPPSSVRGIVVSGSGHVGARPDQGTVSAGVQTRGRTAQEAQSENNRSMQSVIDAIKALGIPDRDIQTSGVSLYPMYDQGQTITGYNASNNVTITVEQVDQVGTVLDSAVRAGANQATNVRFGFKDESALRNKALAAAAADARAKADALAGALGLTVTGIESVAEGGVSVPIINQPRALGIAAAAPSAAPIEPGELNVTAQVTIVFGY